MTVLKSNISWTNSTWNFAVGCDKVSEGCLHCYAEALVTRMPHQFGAPFSEVRLHPERLAHVRKFKPVNGAPHMVFTNSMSDWAHDAIPDEFLHRVFDAMEANPQTIFQLLTKRPIRARTYLVNRYGNRGMPANLWVGTSVENNDVAARIKILRSIKDRTGGSMTAFLSVEPIVGPTDQLDFEGMDWIILGGESGIGARIMRREWLTAALEAAQRRGIPTWLKQHGQVRSHPNLSAAPASLGITAQFAWLVEHGFEVLPQEKGGATIDKQTYRELPAHFHTLKAAMTPTLV